jgi:hypothetical protein
MPMPEPRLLDVQKAAAYASVGPQTIRDWVAAKLLPTIQMPGSTLRRNGHIVAPANKRRIAKILIDRADLDALIEESKRGGR